MKVSELHLKLCQAYSIDNLNKISLTLLNLYKNGQYSVLQKIAEIISDFIIIRINDDGKGFSKLMMLYHPDRAQFHLGEINRLTLQNNFDGLLGYSHILRLERIEEIAVALDNLEDIDYSPVYEWDLETVGFSVVDDCGPGEFVRVKTKTNTKLVGYNFYDAIKLREYGTTESEFPRYYLENVDEFELSSSDIVDLEGVQFCTHAISIDLSNNRIADLLPIATLINLEELILSDNQISFIDALSNLLKLKSLNLSDNMIDDISPLFILENLEYVDLSGNNVSDEQINKLLEAGVTVDI